jgi:hypothetical protein
LQHLLLRRLLAEVKERESGRRNAKNARRHYSADTEPRP